MSTPRIEELIGIALASRFAELHVHGFATVDSFDADERTCTCTPVVTRPVDSDEDPGAVLFERPPAVQNVMVMFLGGANFSLTWDVAAGDTVLLAYLDFSPLAWRERGAQSDPPELTQNGPSYPVAIPVFRPRGKAGPANGTADGVAVRVEGSALHVGEGLQKVALAELVGAELETIWTTLASGLTSASGGPVTLVGTPHTPGDVGAGNLRADP